MRALNLNIMNQSVRYLCRYKAALAKKKANGSKRQKRFNSFRHFGQYKPIQNFPIESLQPVQVSIMCTPPPGSFRVNTPEVNIVIQFNLSKETLLSF